MTPKEIAQLLDIRYNSTLLLKCDAFVAFFGRRSDQIAFSELCEELTEIPTYLHSSETGDDHMRYYTTWKE